MAFTVSISGIPVGSYRTIFSDWAESIHESYGDRIQFIFRVVGG